MEVLKKTQTLLIRMMTINLDVGTLNFKFKDLNKHFKMFHVLQMSRLKKYRSNMFRKEMRLSSGNKNMKILVVK
jgi:hypothetical protein